LNKVDVRKEQMEYMNKTNNQNEIRGKETESEYHERNEANKKVNIERSKQIIIHMYERIRLPIMQTCMLAYLVVNTIIIKIIGMYSTRRYDSIFGIAVSCSILGNK
jgi:hypothetical protein